MARSGLSKRRLMSQLPHQSQLPQCQCQSLSYPESAPSVSTPPRAPTAPLEAFLRCRTETNQRYDRTRYHGTSPMLDPRTRLSRLSRASPRLAAGIAMFLTRNQFHKLTFFYIFQSNVIPMQRSYFIILNYRYKNIY